MRVISKMIAIDVSKQVLDADPKEIIQEIDFTGKP